MSRQRFSNSLVAICVAYSIFATTIVTPETCNMVANQKFSIDSSDFKMTKQLNLEIGGGSEMGRSIVAEILSGVEGIKREIGGSTSGEEAGVRAERDLPTKNKTTDKELVALIKDLYSEISDLKKNLSKIENSASASECTIESHIREGRSHPVGISYSRQCPPTALNTEVTEVQKYFPRSCKEIQAKGNNISGIYEIQPKKSNKPLNVLCDMETQGGGWTVIQKRYDGSVDFNLEWREYKLGFGDLGGEFWIGLEDIYKMTAFEANELLVEIVDRDNVSAYAHYKSFGIGSEPEGYPLNVLKGFSGDAGDSLTSHLGMKFTTKDFDQDSYKDNCAVMFLGGWWYTGCHISNLNGRFMNVDITTHHKYQGMHWKTFRSHEYSHAKSRMMVRPVVV